MVKLFPTVAMCNICLLFACICLYKFKLLNYIKVLFDWLDLVDIAV